MIWIHPTYRAIKFNFGGCGYVLASHALRCRPNMSWVRTGKDIFAYSKSGFRFASRVDSMYPSYESIGYRSRMHHYVSVRMWGWLP